MAGGSSAMELAPSHHPPDAIVDERIMMFPPFWGLPTISDILLRQIQQDLERMKEGCDATLRATLGLRPVDVAQTPAEVVYVENKLRLLHYYPVAQQSYTPPLLIVPSLINRYYILDLLPGKSLVEYLVGHGIDVYLIDWGKAGPEDRRVTFDEYITGYLRRALQVVRSRSKQSQVSLLGYSLGGVFAAIFTVLYPQYVRNLIEIAAPVNFHDDGVLSQWTRKDLFNVDLVVDTLGNMPAALMEASFRMLKPTAQIAQHIAFATKLGDTQAVRDFLALQSWIADSTPFPGEAYRKFIKECYQENLLIQGKLVIDGRRVDLSRVDCPLLTVTAAKDQICPPRSVAVLNDLVSSTDKQLVELAGGHISLIAGRTASSQLWPNLEDWLIARSESGLPATIPEDA